MNVAAHSLAQLVAANQLGGEEVITALLAVARQIGLSDTEAKRTIESGMTAGIRSPRRVA